MLVCVLQASKQGGRKMETDRLTNSRHRTGAYDGAKWRSEMHLRNCRTMERLAAGSARVIAGAKWTEKHHRSRYVKGGYITREMNPNALDDLAWYTGEALSWDGKVDHEALEEWGDTVALEVLKQQGYRVAADADYDWVATVLGGNAETLFVDAAEAVRESVDYIKSDY